MADPVFSLPQAPGAFNRVIDGPRPWLGVYFRCAKSYIRVFRNARGTGYLATCPKCGRCAKFRVGQGGSNNRFFEVSCKS